MILKAHRQTLRLGSFNSTQMESLLSGGSARHYILKRSTFTVEHHRWACGDIALDTGLYSFPVRILGEFSSDKVCIGYMRSQGGTIRVNGHQAGPDTVEYYPPGSELDYRASAGGQWVAITVGERLLQVAAHRRTGRELILPREGAVSFPVQKTLRRELDKLVSRMMGFSEIHLAVIELLANTVAEVLEARQYAFPGAGEKSEHRQQLLRRADKYLLCQMASPFRIDALASATGTTARTLQRLYHDAYGMTPQLWARCLLLHRVRELLQSPASRGLTVEAIARDCGFRHMGRFSDYYRKLFGELPSDTRSNPITVSGGHSQ